MFVTQWLNEHILKCFVCLVVCLDPMIKGCDQLVQ